MLSLIQGILLLLLYVGVPACALASLVWIVNLNSTAKRIQNPAIVPKSFLERSWIPIIACVAILLLSTSKGLMTLLFLIPSALLYYIPTITMFWAIVRKYRRVSMSTPKIESLLVTYIISIILLNLTAVSGGDGLREYAFTFFQVDMPSALYAFSTAVAFIAFAVGIASNATLSVLLHKRMNWLKRSQAAPQNTAQDAVSVPQQYAQSPEQTSPQTPPAPPNSNPQQ